MSESVLTLPSEEQTSGVDSLHEPESTPRERFLAWFSVPGNLVTLGVAVIATAFVAYVVGIQLVFVNTTPTGGDMGAHVWGPAFLRDHLIPNGELTGWTKDWYQGFPAYTFYMVVPSLAIVLLDAGLINPTTTWHIGGANLPVGYVVSALVIVVGLALCWWAAGKRSKLLRWSVWLGVLVSIPWVIDLPYNIAFKLITVSGLLGFPSAVIYLGRSLRLAQPGPELMAISSLFFLCDRYLFNIYGGNIASTMAGEFAFSISFTLSLVALGLVARGLETGRYRALTAFVLAMAALCHVIPAFFVAVGAVVLLVLRPSLRAFKWTAWVAPVSVLITMGWYLPFYGFSTYLNDMGWEKLGTEEVAPCVHEMTRDMAQVHLLPFAPSKPDQPEMYLGTAFFILAAIGAVLSIVMMVRSGAFFALIAAIAAAAFWFMPASRFWNGRVLPFYYLMVYFLAAIAVLMIVRLGALIFSGDWFSLSTGVSVVMVFCALFFGGIYMAIWMRDFVGVERTAPDPKDLVNKEGGARLGPFVTNQRATPVRGWGEWNFNGLERKGALPPAPNAYNVSAEYFAMINMATEVGQNVGCGMAYWEYENDFIGKYGTPMATMLLPYFTQGCIGSMEGLYFEASSTTPFHFGLQSELSQKPSRAERLDEHLGFECKADPYSPYSLDKGIKHMELMGIRYYMTWSNKQKTDAAGDDRLRLVADNGTWQMYELVNWKPVEVATYLPAVWTDVEDDIHSWVRPAWEWFDEPADWDVWRANGGPSDWPRMNWQDDADRIAIPDSDVKVTNLRITQDSVSFDVDKTGVPVIVKMSYFPNWHASGADGPWRVAPNFMVVVPTDNTVTLEYGHSALEWLSLLLSAIGLLGWLVLCTRRDPVLSTEPKQWFGDREAERPSAFWQEAEKAEPVPHATATIPIVTLPMASETSETTSDFSEPWGKSPSWQEPAKPEPPIQEPVAPAEPSREEDGTTDTRSAEEPPAESP